MKSLKNLLDKIFAWLDSGTHKRGKRLINQFIPIMICAVLFALFILASHIFIKFLINPATDEGIEMKLHLPDIVVGFFLYFVTAVDYALIVGRMQVSNPGSKARIIMNIFTCIGCFVGVSLVLFMWAFAQESDVIIVPLLIFAGSVMFKLGYEGIEYFSEASSIPLPIRRITGFVLVAGYTLTKPFTFWIPELSKPKTERLTAMQVAKWSAVLPFIIGLDDMVGYMGAMTIYNVFSLLFGIYLADIAIDILIFVSPTLTKKVVQSAVLSLLAAYAFLYLAYKSYTEAFDVIGEHLDISVWLILLVGIGGLVGVYVINFLVNRGFAKKS